MIPPRLTPSPFELLQPRLRRTRDTTGDIQVPSACQGAAQLTACHRAGYPASPGHCSESKRISDPIGARADNTNRSRELRSVRMSQPDAQQTTDESIEAARQSPEPFWP